jgi:hypothetical protein
MREAMVTAMTTTLQTRRTGALLACGATLSWLVACAPKGPPPRAAEVPIDQFQATGPAPAGPEAPAGPTEAVVEPAAVATPGARPAPLPTPAAAAPGAGAPLPPAERLSAAECSKLIDKGAVLFGVSKGMSAAKASKAVARLRNDARADATYAHVKGSCADHTTKGAFACGMKAPEFDDWKACVEGP